jgi:hypothetical protein
MININMVDREMNPDPTRRSPTSSPRPPVSYRIRDLSLPEDYRSDRGLHPEGYRIQEPESTDGYSINELLTPEGYTIQELLTIFGIHEMVTKKQISDLGELYRNQYRNKPKYAIFFKNSAEKLLKQYIQVTGILSDTQTTASNPDVVDFDTRSSSERTIIDSDSQHHTTTYKEVYIHINSLYKETYQTNHTTDFIVHLSTPVKNVVSVTIEHVEIPIMAYLVFNPIKFKYLINDQSTHHIVNYPAGNYTVDDFASMIVVAAPETVKFANDAKSYSNKAYDTEELAVAQQALEDARDLFKTWDTTHDGHNEVSAVEVATHAILVADACVNYITTDNAIKDIALQMPLASASEQLELVDQSTVLKTERLEHGLDRSNEKKEVEDAYENVASSDATEIIHICISKCDWRTYIFASTEFTIIQDPTSNIFKNLGFTQEGNLKSTLMHTRNHISNIPIDLNGELRSHVLISDKQCNLSGTNYMILELNDFNNNSHDNVIHTNNKDNTMSEPPEYRTLERYMDDNGEYALDLPNEIVRYYTQATRFKNQLYHVYRNTLSQEKQSQITPPVFTDFIFKLPIDRTTSTSHNSSLFINSTAIHKFHNAPKTIHKLQVKLMDSFGEPIEFMKEDWSFTCKLVVKISSVNK